MNFHVRTVLPILVLLVGISGCQRRNGFTADTSLAVPVTGKPTMSGKLYLRGTRLRLDWGQFVEVFDVQQRKGWRIIPVAHAYEELGSKELSTYAPEMTNGSLCPHAQVPSACKFVGKENIEGRTAKKWDVYNPNGFHVYFWTDDVLEITLRMEVGDAGSYEVRKLTARSIPDSMFEVPAGYSRQDRRFTP